MHSPVSTAGEHHGLLTKVGNVDALGHALGQALGHRWAHKQLQADARKHSIAHDEHELEGKMRRNVSSGGGHSYVPRLTEVPSRGGAAEVGTAVCLA